MRKRVTESDSTHPRSQEPAWLDLDALATVEVTSESAEHPIEAALLPGRTGGWQAAGAGVQTIRLLFDQPQRIGRIELTFAGDATERTQEYVMRWRPDGDSAYRDIVRQQWNFGSPEARVEHETHRVELSGLTALELTINPDLGGRAVLATLERLRVG